MTTKAHDNLLSVVVPLYNERAGLAAFHESLVKVLNQVAPQSYEIIYCDDGSTDGTGTLVADWHKQDERVKLLTLSRNFGKEIATSAGIHAAQAQAIIMIDGDGQHPVELIPEFVAKWQAGSKVVIGIRTSNQKEGLIKRWGSKLFYRVLNRFTGMKMVPGSADFRLIDATVQQEFVRLTERNRMTRGLIDWLGYERDYIPFKANARATGEYGYSFGKLLKLAVDGVVSLSISPLYITAYIGAVVLPLSILLGAVMLINLFFGDPLGLHATGSAYVMVVVLFLVGVLLVSQGIIGLYLSHIHTETQNRPLYIVDTHRSLGVSGDS